MKIEAQNRAGQRSPARVIRKQRPAGRSRPNLAAAFIQTTQKTLDLNDARIRQALLRKLARQKMRPRAVLEELHVHNGNAIADVVTLHSEAHCYEIKVATDRIERILVQAPYYNAAFRRITLVTTECKLRRALKLVPPFSGVLW